MKLTEANVKKTLKDINPLLQKLKGQYNHLERIADKSGLRANVRRYSEISESINILCDEIDALAPMGKGADDVISEETAMRILTAVVDIMPYTKLSKFGATIHPEFKEMSEIAKKLIPKLQELKSDCVVLLEGKSHKRMPTVARFVVGTTLGLSGLVGGVFAQGTVPKTASVVVGLTGAHIAGYNRKRLSHVDQYLQTYGTSEGGPTP